MVNVHFVKYQGTGNDFVMIDNRAGLVNRQNLEWVKQVCRRRMGVGADGLILIEEAEGYDFEVVYFNADGSQSLCGNGSRCAVAFAAELGMITDRAHFLAIDGPHEAFIKEDLVHLKMGNVPEVTIYGIDNFVDTGSPHHIVWTDDAEGMDVVGLGRRIRQEPRYAPGGTNVNFVQEMSSGELYVRTYERGVEDETLSCGTGVTAACLAASHRGHQSPVTVHTLGGVLSVAFAPTNNGGFEEVYLIGPAQRVYAGELAY